MSDCCNSINPNSENAQNCPSCGVVGKKIKLITLKSMLKPTSLEMLNVEVDYYFCSTDHCKVVYYHSKQNQFTTFDIKVPVFQKDSSLATPVCYCFAWTKGKILETIPNDEALHPIEHIRENIKANRCGCEVNNPQGSCCLANVTKFITQFEGKYELL